ncbi:ATP-binding cassette domain-containing protein [Enterobacillus tribolii]|uniref:ABC-2 type transport system ATP-binding protein n=1 Tax=Enterobacillus tribolii TaxID=1487935 RepID=A0A370QEP5_9GAMM|nr:ATP-binding cassette domain-containing protein [Enterobacillus tribolii]MBW7984118.1 ABC transporter ATP-binding protein [Enterobacillus tribolii]RDK86821.1 ABC-2 type transport system ATP-binding protein [Enterobacillus tribolii]
MIKPTHVIELESLQKHFPARDTPAIADLTTVLRSGVVTGLIGPDGAGKTTLIRILAGLMTPTSGKVQVAGLDPITQDRRLHTILGYMPQKFGLYEDLTVIENLTLYAELRGVRGERRKQAFDRLLTFTDLTRFTHRMAGKLSGGMKQKLGLACTLLGQPQVLLLDEPSVGVDPISRTELWRMVHELADSGMLILWSTSYLDEAERCSDILLLNEGKLLFNGVPQTLTQGMAGRTVLIETQEISHRALLQQAICLPDVGDGVIQGKYLRLSLKKGADRHRLLRDLNLFAAKIIDTPPRFEDAFIDLLGGSMDSKSVLTEVLSAIDAPPDETVIEARELTKKYGSFTANDRVNFRVRRGEIFGLLGPNGAGKSTTFKMMCGLQVPSAGQALVLGTDLKTGSGNVRQRLGYMAQKFALYGNLTVAQNLKFFSGIYGLRGQKQRDKMAEMTGAFNLHPLLNQKTDSLSLGYKQRLALACALMHEPDILFLDEPTSGVDPITRREFWLHINGMVDKGVTVMVTTHFMEEAEYCDRIGLVYRGKIIAIGTPDALKHQVTSEQTPDPTMEQTFIALIKNYDAKEAQ